MLRDIHYAHSVKSRNVEQKLREAMDTNRSERMQSIRYGLFFVIASVISGILWLALPEPSWLVKLLPVLYSFVAWYYFHKQPGLDREHEKLNLEVNDVLRQRVDSLNWKILIHKLALVLGYKRVPGVEVFHIEGDFDHHDRSVYH